MTPKTMAWSLLRKLAGRSAQSSIQSNKKLWGALSSYLEKSNSTGCNFIDYAELYRHIRAKKPKTILECGTGVSTVVIAHALSENAKDGVEGKVVSMEEIPKYYDLAQKILPAEYSRYVDIRLSPVVEDSYSLFRGVRYRDVPKLDYDFAFVDGPSYVAPSDGMLTFDFDFIHAVKNSTRPISAIVDKRVSTCYVLQKVFGPKKVKYDGIRHLGYCIDCSAADLKDFDKKSPSGAFSRSFRLFRSSSLDFYLSR